MDLRRLNRILEIDEKNMFAVIEPYVIGSQLQAEVMKLGLNCHIIGAGGNCSPLAAATSFIGNGADGVFMGYSSETLLALEWVTPNGDILRTGSLGAGLGWSCGEGPGPSLRGIARGTTGASGALGVFTKCAVKLASWPGPAEMPVDGTIPAYHTNLPNNLRAYTLAMPSWEAYTDAYYKIYDAEIGYIGHRQFSMLGEDLSTAFFALYRDPTKSLDDLEEFTRKPEIQRLAEELRHYSFQLILAGMTPRDIEYQEKVLDQILAETGGHRVAAMSEPATEQFVLLYLLKLHCKHLNHVYAGGKGQYFRPDGSPDYSIEYAPFMIDFLKKHQERGKLVKTGGDSLMGTLAAIGGGGDFHLEQFVSYNRNDMESINATRELAEEARKVAAERMPGSSAALAGLPPDAMIAALDASAQSIRFHWQWKIKQMLDPNGVGEPAGYPMLKEPPKE
jgi:glycolate oxidase